MELRCGRGRGGLRVLMQEVVCECVRWSVRVWGQSGAPWRLLKRRLAMAHQMTVEEALDILNDDVLRRKHAEVHEMASLLDDCCGCCGIGIGTAPRAAVWGV